MNCSYSTHCTSRFISSTIDPLSKFKQLQKQKFIDMYDKISEQPFAQAIQCLDQTIELSIQPSLHSQKSIHSIHSKQQSNHQSINFSYQAKKLEFVEGSQQSIKTCKRKRIFDSLNIELVNHTQLFQFQNLAYSNVSTERKRLVSQQIQTSFVSQIDQKAEISMNNQSMQSLFKNKDGNLLEYLEDNYNYTKWQNHNNWQPNISETKFRLPEEGFKYNYCDKCKNILKDQNVSIHSNYCGINECKGYKEMLLKFKYLLGLECNQLRDHNVQCQQSRVCCFAGLEILEQLVLCKQQRRISKLKQDLLQINEYIQRLQNQYTEQVCQIFNHLISKI